MKKKHKFSARLRLAKRRAKLAASGLGKRLWAATMDPLAEAIEELIERGRQASLAKAEMGADGERKRLTAAIFDASPGSAVEREALAAFASSQGAMQHEAKTGSLLFLATMTGRREAVEALIAAGSNVDGTKQERPLIAVGDIEIGRMLLAAGADAKLHGLNGNGHDTTALHAACQRGSAEWVAELVPFSSVDELNKLGRAAIDELFHNETLFNETEHSRSRMPKLRTLISAGARLSKRDASGSTILTVAIDRGLVAESLALADAGAPFESGENGEGVVAKALAGGHRELAEELWRRGNGLNGQANGNYWTERASSTKKKPSRASFEVGGALHWAAWAGSLPIVLSLLEAAANEGEEGLRTLNKPTVVRGVAGDRRGRTALALAASSGWIEIVNALLAAGAHIDKEAQAHVPIQSAGVEAGRQGVELTSVLGMSAMSGSVETAKAIFAAGEHGQDAIDEAFWCASQVSVEMMDLFEPSSADVKIDGISALNIALAAEAGKPETSCKRAAIEKLLAMGANANDCPPTTKSTRIFITQKAPLHRAIAMGRADLVKILLGAGADIWALDESSEGVLDMVIGRSIGFLFTMANVIAEEIVLLKIISQAMVDKDAERAERVFSRALARQAIDAQHNLTLGGRQLLQELNERCAALRDARMIASSLQKDGPPAAPRKKSRL